MSDPDPPPRPDKIPSSSSSTAIPSPHPSTYHQPPAHYLDTTTGAGPSVPLKRGGLLGHTVDPALAGLKEEGGENGDAELEDGMGKPVDMSELRQPQPHYRETTTAAGGSYQALKKATPLSNLIDPALTSLRNVAEDTREREVEPGLDAERLGWKGKEPAKGNIGSVGHSKENGTAVVPAGVGSAHSDMFSRGGTGSTSSVNPDRDPAPGSGMRGFGGYVDSRGHAAFQVSAIGATAIPPAGYQDTYYPARTAPAPLIKSPISSTPSHMPSSTPSRAPYETPKSVTGSPASAAATDALTLARSIQSAGGCRTGEDRGIETREVEEKVDKGKGKAKQVKEDLGAHRGAGMRELEDDEHFGWGGGADGGRAVEDDLDDAQARGTAEVFLASSPHRLPPATTTFSSSRPTLSGPSADIAPAAEDNDPVGPAFPVDAQTRTSARKRERQETEGEAARVEKEKPALKRLRATSIDGESSGSIAAGYASTSIAVLPSSAGDLGAGSSGEMVDTDMDDVEAPNQATTSGREAVNGPAGTSTINTTSGVTPEMGGTGTTASPHASASAPAAMPQPAPVEETLQPALAGGLVCDHATPHPTTYLWPQLRTCQRSPRHLLPAGVIFPSYPVPSYPVLRCFGLCRW